MLSGHSRVTTTVVLSLFGLWGLASACAPPAPPAPPPPSPAAPKPAEAAKPPQAAVTLSWEETTYQAAKKEGKIVFQIQDPEAFKPIKEGFEKRYPGLVLEEVTGRGAEVRERIIAEQQARAVSIDGMGGTPYEIEALGYTDPYEPPEIEQVREEFRDPERAFTPLNFSLHGIMVNSRLVASGEEPKTWAELADPKWKGKIALQDPRGSGSGMKLLTAVLKNPQLGESYIRKLGDQDIFIGREVRQLVTDLVRGEHAVILGASASIAVTERLRGSPVKFIKPAEGVGGMISWAMVVKNSPHPNAVRLWVNWNLTEEGQRLRAELGGDTPVRRTMSIAHPEPDMAGVKVLAELWTRAEEGKVREYTRLWSDIFKLGA